MKITDQGEDLPLPLVIIIVVYRAVEKGGHCEPVRTLAWQSPPNFQNVDGDSHVGAMPLLGMTSVFLKVHRNAKLQFAEQNRRHPEVPSVLDIRVSAYLDKQTIDSTWLQRGNRSAAWALFRVYPRSFSRATSRARVAGSQET